MGVCVYVYVHTLSALEDDLHLIEHASKLFSLTVLVLAMNRPATTPWTVTHGGLRRSPWRPR